MDSEILVGEEATRCQPRQPLPTAKTEKNYFFYVLSFQIRLDLAGKGTCKKNGYFMVRLTIRVEPPLWSGYRDFFNKKLHIFTYFTIL